MQLLLKGSREQLHPERTEIQECFLRAGAEVDSLQYAWKVRAMEHYVRTMSCSSPKPKSKNSMPSSQSSLRHARLSLATSSSVLQSAKCAYEC
jgi:hypothetical protein